jgi:hypothetical protein
MEIVKTSTLFLAVVFLCRPLIAQPAVQVTRTFTGEAAGDHFGVRVANAGDIDGDRIPDVIVAAIWNDSGGTDAGRVYLYSGATGTLLHTLTGEATNDWFGISVAGLGDLNGDGRDEVLIGAWWNDAGGLDAGRAYIYSFRNGTATLIGTLTGSIPGENLGFSASGVDDVDGDRILDAIVGAPQIDSGPGRAYVRSGASGAILYVLEGEAASDEFGYSVSGAGDIDGDGRADLLIGARRHGDQLGKAYVFSGATGALLYSLPGQPGDYWLGCSVAKAGDINGDGAPDIVVGTDAQRVHVYSGPTGSLLFTINSPASSYDAFGTSVFGTPDVDGDGRPDLLIGAYYTDSNGTRSGSVHIYSSTTLALFGSLNGEATWDYLGASVAAMGDLDGDGNPEFLTGAHGNSAAGAEAGRAYLFRIAGLCSAFIRGDVNADGLTNFGDVVFLSGYLFLRRAPPPCKDAADANDDGVLDPRDIISLLKHLLGFDPALDAPFPSCGVDPTPDSLKCESFMPCA